jgi:hypothetical protein
MKKALIAVPIVIIAMASGLYADGISLLEVGVNPATVVTDQPQLLYNFLS